MHVLTSAYAALYEHTCSLSFAHEQLVMNAHAPSDECIQALAYEAEWCATLNSSGGAKHVLALSDSGDVYAWGTGTSGQLGMGKRRSFPSPQVATPLTP